MTINVRRAATAAAVCVLAPVAAGCAMSWDDKVNHLRFAGERGADAHYVLLTENKPTTAEVCTENYQLFTGGTPDDEPNRSPVPAPEWHALVLDYFVDSCVSGQPRVPATRPTTTPTEPTAPSTTTAP